MELTTNSGTIGDVDLHLFNEGTHRRLWQMLGPNALDGGAVRFAVWAPNARSVCVVGDWNDWEVGADPLAAQGGSGVWSAATAARSGQHYKFVVTTAERQAVWKADPMARRTEVPPNDGSVVPSFEPYEWHDAEFVAARSHGMALRVYEVHLGSWQQGLDYRQLAEGLADHVVRLGFTHVELLPVAEHPFGGSWGYQVSGYYAPTARYGSPDDFRAFVDVLHQRGIGVILDWVPAHFPRDAWSLGRFDGTALYEHADPRQGEHPDWGTYVFNYGRTEVRNFLVANALYWMHEFHIDGLRVDAVASMLYLDYSRQAGEWVPNRHGGRENLDAIDFLQQLNVVVGDEVPGAAMIAEESTAWPKVTGPVHHGGLGFTHKWNMGWMHDTLGYFSNDPVHRKWHHRNLTFGLMYAFTERFVLPLSHDEVVHGKGSLLRRMPGDDWQRFANLRSLFAWMWAMPGSPMLFMGSEMATWWEWNDGASLPWHLLDQPAHRGVFDLITELNRQAAERPALWQLDDEPGGFGWLAADDADHATFAFVRTATADAPVVCVANLTPLPREGYRVGLSRPGAWEVVLDTDAPAFGGSGYRGSAGPVHAEAKSWQGVDQSVVLDLPPLGVLWLAPAR